MNRYVGSLNDYIHDSNDVVHHAFLVGPSPDIYGLEFTYHYSGIYYSDCSSWAAYSKDFGSQYYYFL